MRPPNVPANPPKVYKDGGWQGWVHWLGSSSIKKASKFVPFAQALDFARSLGLANQKEWVAWCQEGLRPPNVPSNPNQTYTGAGWQGWGHWLGTGNKVGGAKGFLPFGDAQNGHQQFLPFDEALAAARSLGLANVKEWSAWCKAGMRPSKVPANPSHAYKDHGWQGWAHWLQHADPDPDYDTGRAPSTARQSGKRAAAGNGKSAGKRQRR